MFHLVHKPLTTPSFLLLCIAFSLLFLFFFKKFLLVATLLSPISAFQSLSVSHSHSVPHVIGGMSSCCSNFTCWQLALSVCLSLYPSFSPSFILSRHHSNSLMHFHKLSSSFFMAALKGLLPKGNGDEERHAG